MRVTAVLVEDGHILLVEQRVTPSSSREWSLPGGGLEEGETIEDCVQREMREETGLSVAIDALLYLCDRIQDGRHVVHITFAVKRLAGELRTGHEPEAWANPIRGVKMAPIVHLADYGFDPPFCALARAGFPQRGTYQRAVANIGL